MRAKTIQSLIAVIILFAFTNIQGQTIFQAARNGNLERVKTLLDSSRTMVDLKDSGGRTPLFLAVYSKNLSVVRLLVENGADVNTASAHSGNVMDFAIAVGEKTITDYLASKGAKPLGVKYATEKLSKNLTYLAYTTGMLNNILIFDGPDGLAIFDSGYNLTAADALKMYLTNNYKNPVKYIFNSHTDGDHIAGNNIYGDKVKNIYRTVLESDNNIINAKKSNSPLKGRTGKSFDTYYTVNLNGEELILIPYPGVHGNEDVVYHFTKSKVVFVGDLLLSQCFPAVGNPAAYLTFLEKLIDVLPEDAVFVSGHGKNINHDGLKRYYNMLKETIDIVKKNVAQGKNLDKMLSENILKEYEKDYSYLTFLAPNSWLNRVFTALQNKTL